MYHRRIACLSSSRALVRTWPQNYPRSCNSCSAACVTLSWRRRRRCLLSSGRSSSWSNSTPHIGSYRPRRWFTTILRTRTPSDRYTRYTCDLSVRLLGLNASGYVRKYGMYVSYFVIFALDRNVIFNENRAEHRRVLLLDTIKKKHERKHDLRYFLSKNRE